MKNYFERVSEQSVTQFYINNPAIEQAKQAIALGATGCTTNPSFAWKMINDSEEQERTRRLFNEAIEEAGNKKDAVPVLQRKLVKPLQELFYPLWEKSGGKTGYVSIQGDPVKEHDPNVIISEAREHRKIGPNICIKIPVTASGLKAIETLVPEDTPVNSTEIMSIAQGVSACETYMAASKKSGKTPEFFVSYIAGIFDEYLLKLASDSNSVIPADIIKQGGMAGMRKMYQIMQEKGYRGTIISGGAREMYHFTELVGANIIGTINWAGTIDTLIQANPDVIHRFFNPVANYVIDTLLDNFPDFQKSYSSNGLRPEEYETFGPVVYFRDNFVSAWEKAGR